MKFDGDFENAIFGLYKLRNNKRALIARGSFDKVFHHLQSRTSGKAERMAKPFNVEQSKVEVYTNSETGTVYHIEYKGKGELQ